MEWKLCDIKTGDAFEERMEHSMFRLHKTKRNNQKDKTLYIFGGTGQKSGKLNDIVELTTNSRETEWHCKIIQESTKQKNLIEAIKGRQKEEENRPCPRESHTTVTFVNNAGRINKAGQDLDDEDNSDEESVMELDERQQVILFGGTDGKNDFNDTWILDPSNGWSWTKVEFDGVKLPPPRHDHTAVVHNDHMWIYGGCNNNKTLDDFWCLDLETMVWSEVTPAAHANKKMVKPEARQGHTSTLINMSEIARVKESRSTSNTSSSSSGPSGMTRSSSNASISSGMTRSSSTTSIKSDSDSGVDEYCMIVIAGLIRFTTHTMSYKDVWAYSFTSAEWLCLSDPEKTNINQDQQISGQPAQNQNKLIKSFQAFGTAASTNIKNTIQTGVNISKKMGSQAVDGIKSFGNAVTLGTYTGTNKYRMLSTSLKNSPNERHAHTSNYIGRGCILVFGGQNPPLAPTKDADVLDLINDEWVSIPRLGLQEEYTWPQARKSNVMYFDSIDNTLFVQGGTNPIKKTTFSNVCAMDVNALFRLIEVGHKLPNKQSSNKSQAELQKEEELYRDIEASTIKIRKDDKNAYHWADRCQLRVNAGLWQDALHDADKGLSIMYSTKKDVDLELELSRNKGNCLFHLGRYKEAIDVLDKVVVTYGEAALSRPEPTVVEITPGLDAIHLQATKIQRAKQLEKLQKFIENNDHVLMMHLIPAYRTRSKSHLKLGREVPRHLDDCTRDCDKAVERLSSYKPPKYLSPELCKERYEQWFLHYVSMHKVKAKACMLQKEYNRAAALVEMALVQVEDVIEDNKKSSSSSNRQSLFNVFKRDSNVDTRDLNVLNRAIRFKKSLEGLRTRVENQSRNNYGASENYQKAIALIAEYKKQKKEQILLEQERNVMSGVYRKMEISDYTLGEEEYNQDDEDEQELNSPISESDSNEESKIVTAIRLLKEAISFRHEFMYLLSLAEAYMANSEFKKALLVAEECVQQCAVGEPPKQAYKAFLLAGYCRVMLNNYKRGQQMFENGLNCLDKQKESWKDDREHFQSAILELKKAQHDVEAKTNARKLGEQYYERAKEFHNNNKDHDALVFYAKALEMAPKNGLYHAGRSESFIGVNDLASAMKDALESVRLSKRQYFGYLAQSRCLVQFHRHVAAMEVLERGLSMDPSNKDLQRELRAVQDFVQNSSNAQMLFERAQFLLRQLEQEMFMEKSKSNQHSKISPQTRRLIAYKISLHTREEDLRDETKNEVSKIQQLLSDAIALDDHAYHFYLHCAQCEYLGGQFTKCTESAKRAMDLCVQDEWLHAQYRKSFSQEQYKSYTESHDGAHLEKKLKRQIRRADAIAESISLGAKSFASLRQFDNAIQFIDQMITRHYIEFDDSLQNVRVVEPTSPSSQEPPHVIELKKKRYESVKQLQIKLSILKEEREHFESLRKQGRRIFLEKKEYNDALLIFNTVIDQIENSSSRSKELEHDEYKRLKIDTPSTPVDYDQEGELIPAGESKVHILVPVIPTTKSTPTIIETAPTPESDNDRSGNQILDVEELSPNRENDNQQLLQDYHDHVSLDDDKEECAMAYYDRAECYHALGKLEECIKDCNKCISLQPHYPHFYVLLCESMLHNNQARQALSICTRALDEYAPFNNALNDIWKKIRLYTCNEEAEEHLQEAQSIASKAKQIAKSAKDKNKPAAPTRQTSITTIRRPIGLKTYSNKASSDSGSSSPQSKPATPPPKSPSPPKQIQINTGKEEQEIKELIQKSNDLYEDCLERLNHSIGLRPNHVPTLLLRARVLLKTNRPQRAIKDTKKAVQLDPESADAVYYKAKSYLRKKDILRAKSTLKKGLDKLKKHDKMLTRLEEVLRLERQYYSAQHKCQDAEEAISRQNTDLAYRLFTEAMELHPTNAIYYCRRSRLLLSLSKSRQALRDAKKAMQVDPAEMETYVCKALAHLELCEYAQAKQSIDQGIKIDDDHEPLKDLLQELRDRQDKSDQAKQKHEQGQLYLNRVFSDASTVDADGEEILVKTNKSGNAIVNVVNEIGGGIASGSIGIMNLALGAVGLRTDKKKKDETASPTVHNQNTAQAEGNLLTRLNDNLLQMMKLKKQEIDLQEQQENDGSTTPSQAKSSAIVATTTEIVVHNKAALSKAQRALLEGSNLEPLNNTYLRDYIESLILSQSQKDQRLKNYEAFYQSMGLIQLHPDYPEAFELFARINSTIYDDQYEALFVAVQGLEQDPKHLGLLHRLYSIIVDFEQTDMRDGGLMVRLRRSAHVSRDDAEENEMFDKEGEDVINEAMGAPAPNVNSIHSNAELKSMSLADLLGDDDDEEFSSAASNQNVLGHMKDALHLDTVWNNMFVKPSEMAGEMAGGMLSKVRSISIPFNLAMGGADEPKDMSIRNDHTAYQAISCVRGFTRNMYQNAVYLLHKQREIAFEVSLCALFVQFDKRKTIQEQDDRFQRLSKMLARGLDVDKRVMDSKLSTLDRRGNKNVSADLVNSYDCMVKEQEPTSLRVTSHKKRKAFYHKSTFASERAFEEFRAQQGMPLEDLRSRYDIKSNAIVDSSSSSSSLDGTSRKGMQIIQFVVDGLYAVLEEEDAMDDKKRTDERHRRRREREERERKQIELDKKRLKEKEKRLQQKAKDMERKRKLREKRRKLDPNIDSESDDEDDEDENSQKSESEDSERDQTTDSESSEESENQDTDDDADDQNSDVDSDASSSNAARAEQDEELAESFRKSIVPISDDAIYIIKCVSRLNGFGHVYPMLVLLEKLSRRFESTHKSNSNLASDICNAYKTMLHIIQGVIDRSLTTMKQGEGMLLFVNTRESELFELAQRRIMNRCQTILDFHWRATTDKMQTILMFCVKVMELVHCFRVLGNNGTVLSEYLASLNKAPRRSRVPRQQITNTISKSASRDMLNRDALGVVGHLQRSMSGDLDVVGGGSGSNQSSPSKFATKDDLEQQQVLSSIIYQKFLECLRNNAKNTMAYFKHKIILRYKKMQQQQMDASDSTSTLDIDDKLQPIHLLALCSCIMEHLQRYKNMFERCFPKSLNLMKNTAEIFYHLFEDEFEKFYLDFKQGRRAAHGASDELNSNSLPDGVLELPDKIDKLHEYFLEYSVNLKPYDTTRLFMPFIYDWINQYEPQLKKVADRAIEKDKWVKISEECDYTTSVFDFFTYVQQSMSFLKQHCDFLKKSRKDAYHPEDDDDQNLDDDTASDLLSDATASSNYIKSGKYTQTGLGSHKSQSSSNTSGNSHSNKLNNLSLIYVTYVDVVCAAMTHYAQKHSAIFNKFAKSMVKLQAEQIEKHKLRPHADKRNFADRLNQFKSIGDDMFTKMKNEIIGNYDEINETERIQSMQDQATIKRMVLCLNNLNECTQRMQTFSHEVRSQLIEESAHVPGGASSKYDSSRNGESNDDDDDETDLTSTNTTATNTNTNTFSDIKSSTSGTTTTNTTSTKKDAMEESLKMMFDTFKTTYRQINHDYLQKGMMDFIVKNVLDTIKNSLLSLIKNDGKAPPSSGTSMMDRIKSMNIQEKLSNAGFDLPSSTNPPNTIEYNKPTVAQPTETPEQAQQINHTFNVALNGVFSYLDDQLGMIVVELNKKLFNQLLYQLFNSLSREIKELIFSNTTVTDHNGTMSERQINHLLITLKKLHKYFYQGGAGLDKNLLDRELALLRKLIKSSRLDSSTLAAEHQELSEKIRQFENKQDERRLIKDSQEAEMAQELAQQDLYDDDDDDDDEEDEDLEDDLDTQVEQLKQLSMDAELDKDDTDSVSEWESDSDHESDQDDEDEDNRKDDDDEDDEEEDDDAPPRHKPSSSKNKLTPQQRQQQRIIRRNYIFAFMNRRVRHNDPVASKLVRYETQQYENAQIKLDTELQALTDAIERSKNDYKQLKDQVKKNDSENKKLRRDYKMLKMLRNITLPHKKISHENKINQSKLTREHRECNQWNDAYQQVDKVLRAETDKLINQFRTRRQKDVQFEKSLNDYIKDQFKIFTIAKEQRESKRVEFKIPLSQQQPFAASSLLRASPEEALRVFGLNHSSPGAPTSPNTLAQRLVILKHYRCLYHFVDGFLCLLEEPNQYITFVPFTDMRQLVMIGGGRSIHELPKLTLKLDEVNSVSKCDLGRRNQSGIEILDRSGRNHQFHGLDDRDDAYEAVDQFLCERSREFEERRRQQGNVLVQAVRGVFGSHNQHHQQHSTSTSQDSRKVIPRDSNDDKGYPVSDALRKKFTILLHNERLMDQFFCKESAQKLPGNLYLFTDSLCFGASVSIGLSSGKYMYPFDKLSKMSKVQKNGIKVTDKQGRTITYSGIKERDDAFQKICSVIERSKSGALNVLYKQQGNIAVITAHVEQGSQSQEQVMPNISKYAKYLKLDFK